MSKAERDMLERVRLMAGTNPYSKDRDEAALKEAASKLVALRVK